MQRRPLRGVNVVILALFGLTLAACGPESAPTAKQCEGAAAGALQCTPRCQAAFGVSGYCNEG